MDGATITLRDAGDALGYVESLLDANGLPTRDVRSKPGCFSLAYDGDERVGIGGIEVHGTDGLLRSVVVERSARGRGIGTALCESLERQARAAGVGTLYLLTTDATGFFAERGYARVERADAPDAIRGTAEFDDLCPESATLMRKSL